MTLRNVVCSRAGESSREIVLLAHFDQSPLTVEGADNDGSGVAILLQLGKIFAAHPLEHTLVLVFTDGEEYGMLGARRFI